MTRLWLYRVTPRALWAADDVGPVQEKEAGKANAIPGVAAGLGFGAAVSSVDRAQPRRSSDITCTSDNPSPAMPAGLQRRDERWVRLREVPPVHLRLCSPLVCRAVPPGSTCTFLLGCVYARGRGLQRRLVSVQGFKKGERGWTSHRDEVKGTARREQREQETGWGKQRQHARARI